MSRTRRWPPPASIVGCLAFLVVGWSGILAPTLIRSIKSTFDQTDAGMGVFYFAISLGWGIGSFGGGFLTERIGRRPVLTGAASLLGLGMMGLALAPDWGLFLAAALPAGIGAGGIDGGGNGLFLDLFRVNRGRALNLLHLFFSLGSLIGPLVIGPLVVAGLGWTSFLAGTGIAGFAIAILFALVAMPDGRHDRDTVGRDGSAVASVASRLSMPLILLAVAIASYVAAEVGISSWLVRYLEPAPLTTATTALALYWTGLTVGRLLSARLADRFDHVRFATTAVLLMSALLAAAILVPSLPLSIALFGLAGIATGPVFPMIIAIGGDRYPSRSAAVSGFLSGMAVVGSVVYPPVMGFLSVTVGLTVAMLGTVLLGIVSAACLVAVGRLPAAEARAGATS